MNAISRRILSVGSFVFLFALSPLTLADTLAEIYELAVKNDAALKAAEATYRAGKEAEIQGRSALLPQIYARAEMTDGDGDLKANRVIGSVNFPTDDDTDDENENYTISLEQRLFDLPAWFSFKQGKELTKQAEMKFSADQQDLIVRTVESYFKVLREIDNLASTKAAETATARLLEQTEQRFQVGLIAITDVHEARAGNDIATANRLTDEGNLGIAIEQLSVLTGQNHANLWLLKENFPIKPTEPLDRAAWVDFALKNNFLLKASEFAANAALENAHSKKFGHLPTLKGTLSYYDNSNDGTNVDKSTDLHKPFFSDSEGSNFTLNLDFPLYSGGRVSSERRQAYEEYIATRENFINTQRNTIQNARSFHLSVITDVARVNARKQAVVSARSALDATQAGYDVGTRNIVDVLQVQRTLYQALRDYANARIDYIINIVRLKQEAGLLNPQDVYDLNQWLETPPPATKSAS